MIVAGAPYATGRLGPQAVRYTLGRRVWPGYLLERSERQY